MFGGRSVGHRPITVRRPRTHRRNNNAGIFFLAPLIGGALGLLGGGLLFGFTPLAMSLGFMVGTMAASLLFPPPQPQFNLGQPQPEGPVPATISDLNIPSANEGYPVTVVYGYAKLTGNFLWYGKFRSTPIVKTVEAQTSVTQQSSGGLSGRTKSRSETESTQSMEYIAGYRYHLTFDVGLCIGVIDATNDDISVSAIRSHDNDYWSGSISYGGVGDDYDDISAKDGTIRVYWGTPDQLVDSYISPLVSDYAAYRRTMHAVFRDFMIGQAPIVASYTFYVKRIINTPLSITHELSGGQNPADIIYDWLTNTLFGRGLNVTVIDTDSFEAVGDTLTAEDFGLSMSYASNKSVEDVISNVLKYIDGVLVYSGGKYSLRLLRDDYTPSNVPLMTEEFYSDPALSRPGWHETQNDIRVSYTDKLKEYKAGVVKAEDLANVEITGNSRQESYNMPGCTRKEDAAVVASRLLKQRSYPLATVQFKVNRRAYVLEPGDPFRFTKSDWGMSEVCFRVTRVKVGTLDKESLEISAQQDIYRLLDTYTVTAEESRFTDPDTTLVHIEHALVQEIPYVINEELLIGVCVIRKEPLVSVGYEIHLSVDGGVSYMQLNVYNCYGFGGTLDAEYDEKMWDPWDGVKSVDDVGFQFTAWNEDVGDLGETGSRVELLLGYQRAVIIDRSTGAYELIGIQNITAVSGTTYQATGIERGLADTIPLTHPSGAELYVFGRGGLCVLNDPRLITRDQTYYFKFVPFSSAGALTAAGAVAWSITTDGRAHRPYSPTNLRVNGVGRDPVFTRGSDVVVTWQTRSRGHGAGYGDLEENLRYNDTFDDGGYEVEIWDNDPDVGGTLIKTYTTNQERATEFSYVYCPSGSPTPNGTVFSADFDTFTYDNADIVADFIVEPDTMWIRVYGVDDRLNHIPPKRSTNYQEL